ncbi:MAG: hypothetical protein PHO02_01285 [Candidatus Nanoarchaeia archaeon]|nr:hypothetical protein [Candidatus Nanoarchaeia archaeon]
MTITEEISKHFSDTFGFMPIKSTIQIYGDAEWQNFCRNRGIEEKEGVFLTRDLSSHLKASSNFFIQNLFHEYFGHSMYTEHSSPGRALHSLEIELMGEEIKAGLNSAEKAKEFRKQNPKHKAIQALKQRITPEYEGFAMWMECYLSELTDTNRQLKQKFGMLSAEQKVLCKRFIDYSNEYGEHALMFSTGMPKHYNSQILTEIISKIFANKFKDIAFAMVYGSRKPYSDIDMLIVSNTIPCIHFGWLDIYGISPESFENLVSKQDISITDPLFTGDFVCGDEDYLKQTKSRILSAEPTLEFANYHRQHAEKARELAMQYGTETQEYKTAMRYNKSYLANAREIEQGRKPLTLRNLIRLYPAEFAGFKKHYTDNDINTKNNGGI